MAPQTSLISLKKESVLRILRNLRANLPLTKN